MKKMNRNELCFVVGGVDAGIDAFVDIGCLIGIMDTHDHNIENVLLPAVAVAKSPMLLADQAIMLVCVATPTPISVST
jgi:hypothetical protein